MKRVGRGKAPAHCACALIFGFQTHRSDQPAKLASHTSLKENGLRLAELISAPRMESPPDLAVPERTAIEARNLRTHKQQLRMRVVSPRPTAVRAVAVLSLQTHRRRNKVAVSFRFSLPTRVPCYPLVAASPANAHFGSRMSNLFRAPLAY